MKIVNVVNRTSKPFTFKWDGISYTIPPGPKPIPMVDSIAQHGVRKSLYGVDPYLNKGNHKVGIEGVHDCSMLDEAKEGPKMKSHLDMKRVESVEGKKFGEKQLDNPLEINDPGEATSQKDGNKAGFSATAEGK